MRENFSTIRLRACGLVFIDNYFNKNTSCTSISQLKYDVYQPKLMCLNLVIAPIAMQLLPITLYVQGSGTKLFQLISNCTNQFVLKAVHVFLCLFFFFDKLQSHMSSAFRAEQV